MGRDNAVNLHARVFGLIAALANSAAADATQVF